MWRRMRFRRRLPKPNLLAVAPYSGQIQHCTACSRVDGSGACRPMACARSTDLSRSRTPSDTWPADVLQSNWRIQTCDTGSMGVPRRYQGRSVRQGRRTKCKCCSQGRSCRLLGSGGAEYVGTQNVPGNPGNCLDAQNSVSRNLAPAVLPPAPHGRSGPHFGCGGFDGLLGGGAPVFQRCSHAYRFP